MIHRIFSNLPSFKELRFSKGFSVLNAVTTTDSTDLHTRNRAGKSSFVDIVRFHLGGNADPDSIFRNDVLRNYQFGMTFDLGDQKVTVERTGNTPSKVIIECDDVSSWPFIPDHDSDLDAISLSIPHWRSVLLQIMFQLNPESTVTTLDADTAQETGLTSSPTFQSLFSYFARRQESGGFASPVKQSSMQQTVDFQMAITFMLGLDWTIPARWQTIRDREKQLKELRKAARRGAFGPFIGSAAELRTELAVAEDAVQTFQSEVDSFEVLPQYRALESEATDLGRRLGQLADENTLDRQMIQELQESISREVESSPLDLERVFGEAKIVFPDLVLRTFQEAREFHDSVVQNRRSYLSVELVSAQNRVSLRTQELESTAQRQSQIMDILHSRGALDQFTAMRAELVRRQAELEAIKHRFHAAEQLEGTKATLDIERGQLKLRLQQDYREQDQLVSHAIVVFQNYSGALYEEAGSLQIRESTNGPQFDLSISGSRSKGINSMQIFCFDMMLMQICSERGIGPEFLIHDSHLFDGVDERQVKTALRLGMKSAKLLNYQYIVTLKSDDIPAGLKEYKEFSSCVLTTKLTDATDDGGLFGVRF